MIPGLSLSAFTSLHVIISLIAIISGIVVMFGFLGSKRMPEMTGIFLLFTILTSATGFLFPFEKLLPSHMIGILSLVLLAIACIALYGMKLSGPWRWIYVVTAMIPLYLNVFVLVIQAFLKDAVACAGPERAAKRTALRRHPGHRACILRGCDHRRRATISAGAGILLIGVAD